MAAVTDRPYGVAPPGYRLPDATRIGRVVLQVADLDRSLAYYEGLLGFRVLERGATEDGRRRARLGAEADDATLVELVELVGATPVPHHGRLGLYHFAILLPDRPALGSFLRVLGERGERAGMSDHLVSEAIYLTDPDGLGIEVYADRPRSEWRHDGHQLVMATEPLDVPAVLAAAGDARWTGMPRGTVIGHVHLFVGDLERAGAFYHEGLGFDRVVWSYPGALFLSAGGYHHHLGTNTWARHAKPAGEGDARLLAWELLLPASDVGAAAGSLASRGAKVERAPDAASARDPWGTLLRLVSAG